MSEDPLEGADVGESKFVSETRTIHAIDLQPDAFRGSDRFGEVTVGDIEVVEDEYGDDEIQITLEGEVTKQLPARWDYHREPVTEAEKIKAKRRTWSRRVGRAVATLVPIGIATVASWNVMGALRSDMTINGEPVAALEPQVFYLLFVFMVLAASAIYLWLPGIAGSSQRRRVA